MAERVPRLLRAIAPPDDRMNFTAKLQSGHMVMASTFRIHSEYNFLYSELVLPRT